MIHKSTSLKYEPFSELLLITAKQLFLNRELRAVAGWTPMHVCVHYAHLAPLRWLLALGLSPEVTFSQVAL